MNDSTKYNNYLKILRSKSSYTQHDYEIANELLKQTKDHSVRDEVVSIMENMNALVENSNNDRMPL